MENSRQVYIDAKLVSVSRSPFHSSFNLSTDSLPECLGREYSSPKLGLPGIAKIRVTGNGSFETGGSLYQV